MAHQSAQWLAAARVLRCAGFGARGSEVDAAVGSDVGALISAALQTDPESDPGARRTPVPTFPALQAPGKAADIVARKQHNKQVQSQLSTLTAWWLQRMVAVQQPLHEKLTMTWHNHFATSVQKVRAAGYMAAQNAKLRAGARGDFRSLAYAMLTDAAMLRWLDGNQNTAKAPNENLAREFMELFSLGHGNGYTETDVRQGARALTGWTIRPDGTSVFNPRRHDGGIKTVLGVTGPLDARGFCDAVLDHPKSAGYVAGSLWQRLVSDTPPSPEALSRLLAAYGPNRNLAALTTAVLTDPDVQAGRTSIVLGPVDWLVGAVRGLQVPIDTEAEALTLASVLRNLGQLPFYPPSVGGWPRGQAWLSTAAAELRLRTAQQLTARADLSAVSQAARSDRVDAVGHLLGIGAWSDRSAAVLAPHVSNPAQLTAIALNTPEYLTV
ncbi:DUF1800 domain-containing protein [Skermania sp. ID1734]|uniref:DUF1800 domain-containing protein n=1 Tax=Skermania sp. ID1734 TaxID=2597516 RepID=UPI00117D73E7|nr:DUF1800 domain-containing protein [Skermania sp. ID1734]TSD94439.1 DUF1800 domain-containing protein [Skermania sp. ID1734]